jgi:hypothetical protein
MIARIRSSCCLLLMGMVTMTGCGGGPQFVPVQGIVTLDGKPIAGAALNFSPQAGGEPSVGVTDEQGHFSLKTIRDQQGAIVGKHRISIFRAKMVPLKPGETPLPEEQGLEGQRLLWVVPRKYAQFEQSGLEADVQPNMPSLELKLISTP